MSARKNCRLPAEWERQAAVWFAWPTREVLWPGRLALVQAQLAELYILAATFEKVCVMCPKESQAGLRALLGDADVALLDYECDDVWCRDFGPLFLLANAGKGLAVSDWRFNAWGGKYEPFERDDAAAAWISGKIGIPRFGEDLVLEGGAIESNGAGVLLTTEAVLLNSNRGAMLERAEMESRLSKGLGVSQVLWLGRGLAGDDTDGHIDNLARLYREGGILYAETPSPEHEDYDALADNAKRIQNFTTINGEGYELKTLPMPKPIYENGEVLAASYLNYMVLNGAVLFPIYGQVDLERTVKGILKDCYPGREVLGFDCREIIREGGALHCLSQHQPALL
ncbi:MAG: agmatine deiminase family protein [Verrucomicrobia bacterium]|nr:agmatine deiminase family protein [Verrucomicrobiota bacterium]